MRETPPPTLTPKATLIEFRGVKKAFGPKVVYSQLDLAIPRGATVTILGASGSGKSVMLKMLIGLFDADGGQILVSSIVREIAGARGDLTFGDPRAVALKGIEGEHVVYPLCWEEFSDET